VAGGTFRFQQIHIEVARNATDDFNPFHDKNRWSNVLDNPFGGPILLGFQLECLIEQQIRLYRERQREIGLIGEQALRFSNYYFRFLRAVKAEQEVELVIQDSRYSGGDNPTLGNRVNLQADGKTALTGQKRESRLPLTLPEANLAGFGDLRSLKDRSFIPNSDIFLKRKFINTSNAKNFMCGSLVEQSDYIDEIEERVQFPEIFPCALLSNALLERAQREGHDFEREPMVYSSHSISVDRTVLATLRSNDALHLLIRPANPQQKTLVYECFGVVDPGRPLFLAVIKLMPLVQGRML
jgi:hypothetical protein